MVNEEKQNNNNNISSNNSSSSADRHQEEEEEHVPMMSNGFHRDGPADGMEENGMHVTTTTTEQQRQQNGATSEAEEEEAEEQLLDEPFDLIVFGSIVQDLVSYTNSFPKPGESVRGHAFKTFCGGKGANQAVMAAKLGTRVSMIGYVGEDMFAANNKQSIASSGVDISLIQTLKGQSTGTACISVNADGENCIIVTLGANELLGAKRAQQVEPVIARASMILCQQEIDQAGNVEAFRLARKHRVCTFFNPAPGHAGMDRSILPLCDIVCANENEAEFLTGLQLVTLEDAQKCGQGIVEQGARIVIITLGPRGALVAQRTADGQIQMDQVDAPKVKAVDTVGAGDCFCGSLAHLLLTAKLQECTADGVVTAVRKAVQIAAISVQKQGAQASYPERAELERQGLLMTMTTTTKTATTTTKKSAMATIKLASSPMVAQQSKYTEMSSASARKATTSFVDIFQNIFGGQLIIRFCSFCTNIILLRLVEQSILGFFNVRMNLFYNFGLLFREPIRKICIGQDVPETETTKYSILSPVLSTFCTLCCSAIWYFSWQIQNASELEIGNSQHLVILFAYSLSIFLEIVVEPVIIGNLKHGSTALYIRNSGILVFVQKNILLILIFLGMDPIMSFTIAQVISSLIYLLLFGDPFALIKIYEDAVRSIVHAGFGENEIKILKVSIFHSFIKQFLTDGANFLMTFTNILPLKIQVC